MMNFIRTADKRASIFHHLTSAKYGVVSAGAAPNTHTDTLAPIKTQNQKKAK